ncbi:SpoVR like protein [Roseibium sp. TrichSKD4]|uniref:SpoVR family protein n=1 Tax=Roseibium sp. TrichSKD4 TaxID=744980 RepID=UPI0001E574F9|nr:SpoVR family protein [Roseibium sp. TrichSKD4]EFO29934.1 SpoVR like protein [Roseibium sp. TrichSKD4]
MVRKTKATRKKPIFEQVDWDFDTLHRAFDAIEEIARDDLELDYYPNQIEIISSEQMLDAYSSIGMPLMYHHWSFGKHFLGHERLYRKGARGLAYEIVINSNPCISYCLEENTMPLQALVMAHAAFGHNHFFKNNHLFQQWTDADGILDYLDYARKFIARCEERHGVGEVEAVLDAAHALMNYGVFRHRRPRQMSVKEADAQRRERLEALEQSAYYLANTMPTPAGASPDETELSLRKQEMQLPEENLLYFLEKYSLILKPWQRETLAIVRTISQYFYPQKQTKVMNEGCACFVHYHIVNKLYEDGKMTDGAMLEILHSHTNVVAQSDFDDPRYSGINPYALGFAMMEDIKRICIDPDEEDREWFPYIAGKEDWRGVLKDAWANFRDESFIQQYLSPKVMRRFHMFALADEVKERHHTVTGIHDELGYRHVRDVLARNHDYATLEPDIQVVDADLLGDRCLHLKAVRCNGIGLDKSSREATLTHVEKLWGYKVDLQEVDALN